ncbi:hypothetical protein P153DRAFT_391182 [Dothidotthia symphoricarpi CBS 119687]|uniref:Uncharacterized protein n=1 Tax=Dothidotthia symphoricarpi CBS 119687 TaxID=1392245 RepID=A0A6A5ZXM0_9PLEO|nr:uncharacterized protein P153DRAFT_391182 [Dothidotthia symphoricarpi CBS 119687]KAF2123765.1 hypothetical protein P153DRAFT_391182 [Dothidotthia symphoricarpi CBS 119687]
METGRQVEGRIQQQLHDEWVEEEKSAARRSWLHGYGIGRAWSIPFDRGQEEEYARRWPADDSTESDSTESDSTESDSNEGSDDGDEPIPANDTLYNWLILLWFLLVSLLFIACNLRDYANMPPPTLLQGWSPDCAPVWLHATSPDRMLAGYDRRYPDVTPPFALVHQRYKASQRCWHADRNRKHTANALHVVLPTANGREYVDNENNLAITRRLDHALSMLTDCRGFPCKGIFSSEASFERWDWLARPDDNLPVQGTSCTRCRLRDAVKQVLHAAIDPSFTDTYMAAYPKTWADLESYCPCDLSTAWAALVQFHAHVPQPFAIHPFYTSRDSSLYAHNDPYSWYLWLRGNSFFWPWRRTNINELSDDEFMSLHVAGYWDAFMPRMAGRRDVGGREVRRQRGVALSRGMKRMIEEECGRYPPRKGDDLGREDCFDIIFAHATLPSSVPLHTSSPTPLILLISIAPAYLHPSNPNLPRKATYHDVPLVFTSHPHRPRPDSNLHFFDITHYQNNTFTLRAARTALLRLIGIPWLPILVLEPLGAAVAHRKVLGVVVVCIWSVAVAGALVWIPRTVDWDLGFDSEEVGVEPVKTTTTTTMTTMMTMKTAMWVPEREDLSSVVGTVVQMSAPVTSAEGWSNDGEDEEGRLNDGADGG